MVHYVLGKRKVVLDQIRQGLGISGVLKQINTHPHFYEELFLAQKDYSPLQVLNLIKFKEGSPERLVDHFERFVTMADTVTLKGLIKYVSGTTFLPRKDINVAFAIRNGFFGGTCTFKLDCPIIEQYDEFSRALTSAILPSKVNFTSV